MVQFFCIYNHIPQFWLLGDIGWLSYIFSWSCKWLSTKYGKFIFVTVTDGHYFTSENNCGSACIFTLVPFSSNVGNISLTKSCCAMQQFDLIQGCCEPRNLQWSCCSSVGLIRRSGSHIYCTSLFHHLNSLLGNSRVVCILNCSYFLCPEVLQFYNILDGHSHNV